MYEVQGTVPFRIKRPLSRQQPNDMNNILSIFLCLFFFFLAAPLQHAGFRISVPPPGIKPMPPAVEARSLNHWTAGKSLSLFFIGKTEEQKSSVAFTGSYSQYVTVSTELRNLRNLHRNQGYRLFHNLFLPRTHAHVRAHAHTHTETHRLLYYAFLPLQSYLSCINTLSHINSMNPLGSSAHPFRHAKGNFVCFLFSRVAMRK